MGNGHSIGRKSASQTDILVERAQRSRSENFPPGCPAISSPRDFRRTTSDLITQLREWEGTVIAKNSPPDAFNVVKLGTKCEKPLFALAFAVLRDVSEVLGLSMDKLAEFCLKVDSHMLENHYHNRLHVADVVQMFYLQTLEGGPLRDDCRDPIVLLAVLVAALVHDVKHPGFSNSFLRLAKSPLVDEFGEECPSESMHFATFKKWMEDDKLDFIENLTSDQRTRLFFLVREMVLATDMAKHVSFVQAEVPVDPVELLVYKLCLGMKTSDLSHCLRNFKVHRKMVVLLKQEFYLQGDAEVRLGKPASVGMSRGENFQEVAKGQVGFLSIFILPLLQKYSVVATETTFLNKLVEILKRNIETWAMLCWRSEQLPEYADGKVSTRETLPTDEIRNRSRIEGDELAELARAHAIAETDGETRALALEIEKRN